MQNTLPIKKVNFKQTKKNYNIRVYCKKITFGTLKCIMSDSLKSYAMYQLLFSSWDQVTERKEVMLLSTYKTFPKCEKKILGQVS